MREAGQDGHQSKRLPKLRKGWRFVPLGSLIANDRPITYGVVQPGEHFEGGVPLIRGGDYSGRWTPIDQLRRVSPQIEKSFARARLRKGDLVITIKGDVGTCAQVPAWLEGANISQTNARLAIDRCRANPRYVLHYLRSQFGRREVYEHTKVGAQPGLIFGDIAKFQVPLPPTLEAQDRIAMLLDVWESAIDKAEQLIAVQEKRRLEIARRLLEDCVPSTGARGRSWNMFRLGELFDERDERGTTSEPLLAITNNRGIVDRDDIDRRDTSNEDKSKYKLICPGDIGYNTMRMWQGVCGMSPVRGIVSPAYTIVTPKHELIRGEFAAALFKLPRMIHEFRRYSQGLVDDTLSLKFPHFSEIKVRVPDPREQHQIAMTLGHMRDEVAIIERQIEALKRQQRGLTQKLLTGEWRAPAGNGDAEKLATRVIEEAT